MNRKKTQQPIQLLNSDPNRIDFSRPRCHLTFHTTRFTQTIRILFNMIIYPVNN